MSDNAEEGKGASALSEFDLAGYRYVPVADVPERAYNVHLRHAVRGTGFEWDGQEHYDNLGDRVIEYLQLVLEREYQLARVELSRGGSGRGVHLFASPDIGPEDDVLLIIHGSGAVRAGMWARQLCINDTLRTGTVFEYVERAQERGWKVVVTNTNEPGAGQAQADPIAHTRAVCEEVLRLGRGAAGDAAAPRRVPIVAHSYGGVCVYELLRTSDVGPSVAEVCPAIAFTDSVHTTGTAMIRDADELDHARRAVRVLEEKARNWVSSDKPVGELIEESGGENACKEVSAGHPGHVHTSAACIDDLFAFLDEKMGRS